MACPTFSISLLFLLLTAAAAAAAEPPQPIPSGGAAISKRSANVTLTRYKTGREFVEAHNKVRIHMDEPPLTWDRNLTRYARDWVAQLASDCRMVHSRDGPYGENLFWGGKDHWTPTDVVRLWVSENRHYDARNNNCTAGEICGHYTQVVWRESRRLGCASVKCNTGGLIAMCTYHPPGNYVNENPFTGSGKPNPPAESPPLR